MPRAKGKGTAPHDLPPEEQLIAKIEEVRKERARLVKLPSTATAVGQTHKLESDLLRELRELRAEGGKVAANPAEELSDAELLDGLCKAILELPDAAIDRVESAVMQRRTGRPALQVVSGGSE